jgi:hypothetical protein
MEKDLLALLAATPAVSAIVSGRISWVERRQGAGAPYVVLHRISGGHDYTMRGRVNYQATRVQVDCWAETTIGAKALADAVSSRLSGYAGTVGGTRFQGVFLDAERDLRDVEANGAERFSRVSQDYFIHHSGA